MATKERISAPPMMSWQYRNMLAQLGQISLHASDDSCPCNQVHMGDDGKHHAEYCLGKHLIDFWSLAQETALMDAPHRDMLDSMASEALEFHEKAKIIYCKGGTWPDLAQWSRDVRKKLEPIYYACTVKPKAAAHLHADMPVFPVCTASLHAPSVAAPAVKITGNCHNKACDFKVTATKINSRMVTIDKPAVKITTPFTTKQDIYPVRFEMGDLVEYQGEQWEIGFVNDGGRHYRLQKGPTAFDKQVNRVYPEELKLIKKSADIKPPIYTERDKELAHAGKPVQARLFDLTGTLIKKLDKCNLNPGESSKALSWKPLRDFISWAIGKGKVSLCSVGMVPGVYQLTVSGLKDIAEAAGKAKIPGSKRVWTLTNDLVYEIVMPEEGGKELEWKAQDIFKMPAKREPSAQAAMFAVKEGKAGVCQSLNAALKDEIHAGDDYRALAFAAKSEGMKDVSHTLKAIAHTEDAHHAKIEGLVAKNCGGFAMELNAFSKIKMFATENDTDKWVVAVDGMFGMFDSKDEAEKVYLSVGGYEGSDGLEGTGFGTAQLMPPSYAPKFIGGWIPEGGIDKISVHRPIDIRDYIIKRPLRAKAKFLPETMTASQRLAEKRFMRDFFSAPGEAHLHDPLLAQIATQICSTGACLAAPRFPVCRGTTSLKCHARV